MVSGEKDFMKRHVRGIEICWLSSNEGPLHLIGDCNTTTIKELWCVPHFLLHLSIRCKGHHDPHLRRANKFQLHFGVFVCHFFFLGVWLHKFSPRINFGSRELFHATLQLKHYNSLVPYLNLLTEIKCALL